MYTKIKSILPAALIHAAFVMSACSTKDRTASLFPDDHSEVDTVVELELYTLREMVLCMTRKNKLSTRRHGEHGEMHGGTPFLRVLCAEKEIARRSQRRNFVPQNSESPCPPCLRVDNLYSMSMHKTMPRTV
jgi:hypothetical protein